MADEKYSPEKKAKQVVDRRRKSLDYWAPIYDEFAEVFQAVQCRTSPIYKRDAQGKELTEEDKTRTNVCMPGLSIMVRKNVARMTAQPPNIDFIARDPIVAQKLSSWHYWQYDVTGEAETRRKTVMQGEMFGIGVEKLFQDDVILRRKVRVRTANATRTQLMTHQGHDPEQVKAHVSLLSDQLSNDEVSKAQVEVGDEFPFEEETTKYSGPVSKSIFFGDLHLPPGADSLETSDWIVEEYVVDPTFFEYWADKKYKDENGDGIAVMDPKNVADMLEKDDELPHDEKTSLRDRFKQFNKLDTTHQYDKELACSKKFKVYECHERRDGKNWIVWVGNEKFFLGEMPYPWDFYGDWAYTALVPLPNVVSAIGDSTPRLGRFLHRLHNVNTGQRQDLITNFNKPFMITREGADIPAEAVDRGAFREMRLRNPADARLEQMPQLPQYAWENENAILRQMAMLEPALNSADLAGTNQNSQSGKTATVGVLAQRERDYLLGFKIDGLNIFLKKLGQKKLWMLQQTLQNTLQIGAKYASPELLNSQSEPPQEAISMRGGRASVITLDWPEIQEDIQVEPKVGSTLSIEDEFHRMGAQTFFQTAMAAPHVFDIFYAAKAYAATIPNIDATKAVLPPVPPPEPPPKVQANINVPLDKMPADVVNQLLPLIGLMPSKELEHIDTLNAVTKLGESADAAAKLEEPAVPEVGAKPDSTAGVRRTAASRV